MPPRPRSITDEEIALIKAMLQSGIEKTKIQAYFTHPDRPVNFGRITNIERDTYGPRIVAAAPDEVERFLASWNVRRGAAVSSVIEAALDPNTLPHTDTRRLSSYFEKRSNGVWILAAGETDEFECKTSFSIGSKVLRAIAALANNRGGYIFFGVANENARVVGLQNSRFQDTDPSRLSQAIRSAMEPMPRIETGICVLDQHTVAAIYVHREEDGPVIVSKTEQELREGTIYYRYPGESRAIAAGEFRRMLAERDNRIRQQSAANIAHLMELGARGTVVDMASGTREAIKIVREGIDEADVLRNFVRQESVEFPLAYLLRSCTTARSWLPIFYYLKQSSLPLSEAIEIIAQRETSYTARKRDLLARLRGEKTAYSCYNTGRIGRVHRQLLRSEFTTPSDSRAASDVVVAMTGLQDSRLDLNRLLQLLRESIEVIRSDASSRVDAWSYIYKASARLDELYFRPS
jgi:Schlafen, AlbA_2